MLDAVLSSAPAIIAEDASFEYFIVGVFMSAIYFLIVFSYCFVQDERKTPALQLAFWLYFCELCFAGGLVAQWFRKNVDDDEACRVLSIWNQFWIFAIVLWFGVMSVNLYVTLKNPWTKYARVGPLYHGLIWGICSGLALHLNFAEKYGISATGLCWVKIIGPIGEVNLYKWGVCFTPILTIFVGSCALNILAFSHVRHSRKKFDTLEDRFQKGNAKYLFATRNARYIMVFGLCLALNGLFYLLAWHRDFDDRSAQLGFVSVFFLRSVLDLLVWGANTGLLKRLRAWFYLCWKRCCRKSKGSGAYRRADSEVILIEPMVPPESTMEDNDLSVSLRNDMMYLTRAGIQTAVLGNAKRNETDESVMQQEDQLLSMRDLRRTEILLDSDHPLSPRKKAGGGSGPPSQNLRPTDMSGSSSVEAARLLNELDDKNCSFKIDYFIPVVDDDGSNMRQATNMFSSTPTGHIPPGMSSPSSNRSNRGSARKGGKQSRGVFDSTDSSSSSESRPRYQHLYKHSRIRFTDHAPQAFCELRRLAGISDIDFTAAFGLQGQMREAGSAGKSGDVFYFTQNMKFLVKTLPTHEVATLKTLLPHYLEHIRAYPSSLVLRFLGLYTVQLPFSQKVMYFVVMKNVLLGQNGEKIHERFDLKGNRDANRRTGLPKGHGLRLDIDYREDVEGDVARTWASVMAEGQGSNGARGGKGKKDKGKGKGVVAGAARSKGLGFGRGGHYQSQLLLSADNRRNLLEQLDADMGFLRAHNLIDYSLLLGVHRADQQPLNERSASFDTAGLLSPPQSQFLLFSPVHKDRASRKSHDDLELVSAGVAGKGHRRGCSDDRGSGGSGSGSEANPQEFPATHGSSASVDTDFSQAESNNNNSSLFFQRTLNELPSTDLRSVYYVGIIDILAKYSWKWALQRYALCLFVGKNPSEVSAVPAGQYADRLMDFVDLLLLGNGNARSSVGGGAAGAGAGAGKQKTGKEKGSTGGDGSNSADNPLTSPPRSARLHHRSASAPGSPNPLESGSPGAPGAPPQSVSPRSRTHDNVRKKGGCKMVKEATMEGTKAAVGGGGGGQLDGAVGK
jgi:hypothetical protein